MCHNDTLDQLNIVPRCTKVSWDTRVLATKASEIAHNLWIIRLDKDLTFGLGNKMIK